MRRAMLILSVLIALPVSAHAQQVRARVIDADQRTPLTSVRISVMDSAGADHASAQTDRNGFFTMDGIAPGSYTLSAELDGYRTVRQPFVVSGTSPVVVPAILLQSEAVALDPVRAEASVERTAEIGERDAIRGEFVLAGSRMAELEKVNASPAAVYRELGVRVQEVQTASGVMFCLQSRRGPNSMRGGGGGSCEQVAVAVDGVLIRDPAMVLRTLKPGAWESIEYLSAVEAGARFGLQGSSSGGAILLWSRGNGPHRNAARDGGSR
ncbi:MAG TPA: carboxypeptidase-like regulatory domain-containing protein [Longimicrobiales bacterium]|nr:carboxypeptidase-like regulatory domain-containing protein [Longimicrobiales bacterium]